ncbi:MAG: helix-turn-helix domain-containing protein [Lachnospiraceae bacterium]|nr:helix-turn-helix domain-containing protein [Lachnospiraceae bacterium]
MEFMTTKQAAEKWGLSERRLQTICNEGKISGVVKFGKAWAIPVDAERPVDKRIKSGRYKKS